jgi:hypothetical protein
MRADQLRAGMQARFAGEWYELTEDPQRMPITDDMPTPTIFIAARLISDPSGQETAIISYSDRLVMTRP